MNYANKKTANRRWHTAISAALFLFAAVNPSHLCAEEEFSFDLDEIEKNPLQIGGYIELQTGHMDINQGAIFTNLNLDDPDRSTMDLIYSSIQLNGSYEQSITSLHWQLKGYAQQDSLSWDDGAEINTAYISLKPAPSSTLSLGKKSYKWGKGYAWNPVGFINRRKDPNNPEESLEGYVTLEGDFIKSYQSDHLQTTALTLALLPVWQEINKDFGEWHNVNLAAKLYVLYLDTDIDLILLAGQSRTDRIGIDFSTNLAPNFEIHGEAAYIPNLQKMVLQKDNSTAIEERGAFSSLLGLRYLSENDTTSIIEYYYNEGGYRKEEMSRFYQLAETAMPDSDVLTRVKEMSIKGYGRPQPGRQYLYTKITHKEPFDLLYFTPGISTLVNLEDRSYSITPEAVYTGITNWEIRLLFSLTNGGCHTEYGEKVHANKLELRVRYFF